MRDLQGLDGGDEVFRGQLRGRGVGVLGVGVGRHEDDCFGQVGVVCDQPRQIGGCDAALVDSCCACVEMREGSVDGDDLVVPFREQVDEPVEVLALELDFDDELLRRWSCGGAIGLRGMDLWCLWFDIGIPAGDMCWVSGFGCEYVDEGHEENDADGRSCCYAPAHGADS